MGGKKRSHGTVFARANGRFTAQISEDGARRSIGTFGSRRAAETALAKALVEGPPLALEATFGGLPHRMDGGPPKESEDADLRDLLRTLSRSARDHLRDVLIETRPTATRSLPV
jgi:hypothetical protein